MIFSLGYTTFLGLIIFGIMRMIKRKKELNFSTFQLVSGCFNLLISLIFLFIYIGGSELLDSTISNPFIYILFTIIVSYFYILSAPISMGNIIFLVEKKTKNSLYLIAINIISCVITTCIIPLFLKWYN